VIWSSFFLISRVQQSETGLVGWVYRVDPAAGSMSLDWTLSRGLAREVAAAYRVPISLQDATSAPTLSGDRRLAADALEAFASDRCGVPRERRESGRGAPVPR
jgi:hypothetical protein